MTLIDLFWLTSFFYKADFFASPYRHTPCVKWEWTYEKYIILKVEILLKRDNLERAYCIIYSRADFV